MNLDHRARRAVRGIRAVADARPIPPPPGTPSAVTGVGGAPWWRAVAAAAVVLVVGAFVAFVARPGLLAPTSLENPEALAVADTTTTTEAPTTTEATTITTEAPTTTVAETTTTTSKPIPTTTTEAKPAAPATKSAPPTTAAPKPAAPVYAIAITAPKHDTETDAASVAVRAEVSGSMSVTVNGTPVTPVGGVVELEVPLGPGWNEIWVKGHVDGQKAAYDKVAVYRVPDESYQVVIASPADGVETEASDVVLTGTATPGLELKVAGTPTPVAADGSWSVTVPLVAGWNEIWAKGYLDGQKVAYDTVTVKRHVAETVDFTAVQANGSSSEAPPWDEFSGTATPGHVVKAYSEYGSAATEVGGDGTWRVRVEFPSAPAGTSFPVVVTNKTTGEAFEFGFEYLPG